MKRKVILHGSSTLTISLPSKWVKANSIRKGDELTVEDQGKSLAVFADGNLHLLSKRTKIDLSDLDNETVHSILSMLHKSGYDEIEVHFKGSETVKLIQERINSMLMGFEIMEQKGNVCIIKSVSGDHPFEIEAIMRRCFLITLSLANNSAEELKSADMIKLKELLVLENTNNKLTNYCERLLNKKPYKDEKTVFLYIIVWILESICDDYRDIIKYALSLPKYHMSKQLCEFYCEVNSLFESYYSLFYDYTDKRNMLLRGRIHLLKERSASLRLREDDKPVETRLLSIINRIFDCLGSTAGIHH